MCKVTASNLIVKFFLQLKLAPSSLTVAWKVYVALQNSLECWTLFPSSKFTSFLNIVTSLHGSWQSHVTVTLSLAEMHPLLGGWMSTIEVSYNKHNKTQHKRHYAKVRSVHNEFKTYFHSHRHEKGIQTWVWEQTLLLHLHWNHWQVNRYMKDIVNKHTAVETLQVYHVTFLVRHRSHVWCCATVIHQKLLC